MIHILMSTYNGERYLSQQLDSIIAQTITDWRLYIHDDGSTDNTMSILQRYAATDSRIIISNDEKSHLGAKDAFFMLLEQHADAPYIAFADQDDVWFSNKLELCLNHIQEKEKGMPQGTPIVAHTDLQVVDEHLNEIAPSFWRFSNLQPQLIESDIHYLAIANCLTGCTMMMNNAAAHVSLPANPKAYMHDAWIGLSTMLHKGIIVPIDIPTMQYRQHGKNTLGAVEYHFTLAQWSWKYMLAKRSYIASHPQVYKSLISFIYWKIRYFIALHL